MRAPAESRPVDLEPVRTPEAVGWLRPSGVASLVFETFGIKVSTRTVQQWTRHRTEPLPSIMLGGRLLVNAEAFRAWYNRRNGNGSGTRE